MGRILPFRTTTLPSSLPDLLALGVLALTTACILFFLLWLMPFGFDLTGEASQLIRIADHPGSVYHPLYQLVGGDIALLRQLNMLLTFGLAWGLMQALLATQLSTIAIHPAARAILAAALACSCFTFLHLWLPSPGNHWLTFQALLLATLSVIWLIRRWHWAWAPLTLALWLAFSTLPVTSDSPGTPFSADDSRLFKLAIIASLLTVLALTAKHPRTQAAGFIALLACATGALLILYGITPAPANAHRISGSIGLAALLIGLAPNPAATLRGLTRTQWALAAFLLVLPFVFAIGNTTHVWEMAGLVSLFWIAAGLIFLSSHARRPDVLRLLLPLAFAVQLLAICTLRDSITHAQLLTHNTTPTILGQQDTVLILPPNTAQAIDSFRAQAANAGFTPGTPVIDLTGNGSGIIYTLGGTRTDSCDSSWILTISSHMSAEHHRVATFTAESAPPLSLLKPKRPAAKAIRACERLREKSA